MGRSGYRGLLFAALACAAIVFGGVVPAQARPLSTLSTPFRAFARHGLTPQAAPPGTKVMDMPMGTGGKISGYIPDGAYHVYHVPLYAGQNLTAHFTSRDPYDGWELDLFDLNLQDGPLQSVYDGGQLAWINYDAMPIEIDYNTYIQYDFGYDLVIFAPPGGGRYTIEWDASDPPSSLFSSRISGENRYATATMGMALFQSPQTVVVATGVNFVDALAASALCGSYDAPLLLTAPKTLSANTKAFIAEKNPTQVFVIGSSKAVSDDVFNALKKTGRTVERVQGTNRFETALAIADKVRLHELAEGRTPGSDVLLVNGFNYPDALAVSPIAFSQRMPILLTAPTYLPPVTGNALIPRGLTTVHVIGSEATISDAVMQALPATANDRIYGADRCGTSSAIATWAFDMGWADWGHVGVVTGYNYPDGLAAGVVAGKQHGVVLLTKPLYMEEVTFTSLYDHRATLTDGNPNSEGPSVMYWGGTNTLSGFVRGEGEEAISGVPW